MVAAPNLLPAQYEVINLEKSQIIEMLVGDIGKIQFNLIREGNGRYLNIYFAGNLNNPPSFDGSEIKVQLTDLPNLEYQLGNIKQIIQDLITNFSEFNTN